MQGLDLKFAVTALSLIIAGIASFYAVKVDIADHEARINFQEQNNKWQWDTIDAERSALNTVKQELGILKAESANRRGR